MRTLHLMLAAVTASSLWSLPSYQVFGLGNLGGPATAYAINNNGVVVGTSANAQGDFRGFVWNGGSLIELAGIPGSFQLYASGINNSGTIAGSADGSAVRWQNGVPSTIGQGPGNAMAVNDAGQVAGMQNGQAFRTVGGQVQYLGTVGGGSWAAAYGINAAGEVAGYGETASGAMRGFVSQNGQLQQIGTLGGSSSYAMAINDSKQVAGHAARANGHLEAFLYYNGTMTALGTLGGVASYAYGINRSGAVVGSSWLDDDDDDGGQAAFLYADGQMRDLNALISPNSGWKLLAAYGINDIGQIVGTGLYNGQQMAVLLNPLAATSPASNFEPAAAGAAVPEPGTIGLLAAGIAFLAFGRWRRNAAPPQE